MLACLLVLFLATGRVPARGDLVRREERPGVFWFGIAAYSLLLFCFTYAALYTGIPWPKP